MFGTIGTDHLVGGGGNDGLSSFGGADILTGGAGSDSFQFQRGDGIDHITDFQAVGPEHDEILLSGDFGITSFKELKTHMSQHGDDVFIDLGQGDQVILDHTTLGDLNTNDFAYSLK
jgi:Ca2+-binding RTX toxin-like protein